MTADQVVFYVWQSLAHATDCILEMGLPVVAVHGKICAKSV